MSKKKIYEEAIYDAKRLKEVATAAAMESAIKKIQPKIKSLIEAHLDAESDEEEVEVAEASGAGAVQGTVLPLGMKDEKEACSDEDSDLMLDEETSSEVAEIEESFSGIKNDSEFLQNVQESMIRARSFATKSTKEKMSEHFFSGINEEIEKVRNSYGYLQEKYRGKGAELIEQKLESAYSVLNATKDSVMKYKKIRENADNEVLLKLKGLPDGIDLDTLSIDLISDEEGAGEDAQAPVGGETPPADAAGGDALDLSGVGAPAPTEQPQAEGRFRKGKMVETMHDDMELEGWEMEAGDINLEGDMDLEDALAAFGDEEDHEGHEGHDDLDMCETDELVEGDGIEDFGGGKSHGEPSTDRALNLQETDMEEECSSAMKEARQRVLSAARKYKTTKTAQAKRVYEKCLVDYRKARLAEKTAVKNTANRQLSEAKARIASLKSELEEKSLLNAKLVEAIKLFGEDSTLSKSDKFAIAEALDKATSTRDVKRFSGAIKTRLNERKQRRETKAARLEESKRNAAKVVAESKVQTQESSTVDRWLGLAGLKVSK